TQHRACWPASTSASGGSSTLHLAMRNLQRGWNLHAAGGLLRSGGLPGMVTNRFLRLASIRGIERSSDQVYGCCGFLKICRVSPASTTRPAYITMTRLQRLATTAMLW